MQISFALAVFVVSVLLTVVVVVAADVDVDVAIVDEAVLVVVLNFGSLWRLLLLMVLLWCC